METSIRDIIANAISRPYDSGWTLDELTYIARTGQFPERAISCAEEYRGK